MKTTLPHYIEVTIPLTQAEFDEYVGVPCPSFDAECETCKAHAQYTATGWITTLVDRAALAQQLTEGTV
jgi:hypothetical protein